MATTRKDVRKVGGEGVSGKTGISPLPHGFYKE
jgi:hypothetical protein